MESVKLMKHFEIISLYVIIFHTNCESVTLLFKSRPLSILQELNCRKGVKIVKMLLSSNIL